MSKRFIALSLLCASAVAGADEKPKAIIEEVPPVADTDKQTETNEVEDGYEVLEVDGDVEAEGELDPPTRDLLDLNLTLSKRWYKKSPFSAQGLQLTTEWGIASLPVRVGPSMRYFDINGTDDFYSGGTLLEFGFRATAFWDMENFLPYLAIDYTAVSSGSIKGHSTLGSSETTAALELSSSGYDLILGSSIFWEDYSFIIEFSLSNSTKVELDGSITTATDPGDGNPVTVNSTKAVGEDSDTFQSVSFGVGFEL